jgi:hypothetical protein
VGRGEIKGTFEVGRPAGHPAGTPLDTTVAINLGRLALPPGGRYVWPLTIDGRSEDSWSVAFSTRAAPASPGR